MKIAGDQKMVAGVVRWRDFSQPIRFEIESVRFTCDVALFATCRLSYFG